MTNGENKKHDWTTIRDDLKLFRFEGLPETLHDFADYVLAAVEAGMKKADACGNGDFVIGHFKESRHSRDIDQRVGLILKHTSGSCVKVTPLLNHDASECTICITIAHVVDYGENNDDYIDQFNSQPDLFYGILRRMGLRDDNFFVHYDLVLYRRGIVSSLRADDYVIIESI